MSKTTFIEKEQDWDNEATLYWFDVSGGLYAISESGGRATIIDGYGDDVIDPELEIELTAALIVTDDMRAA